MKTKDILINNLHKIVRKDEFINTILNPAGLHLDKLKNRINLIQKEFLFSTMSLERIKALEKELSYKTNSITLEGKRIEIEARWKTSGKCDLELLQTIANTWKPETVTIKFINGDIQVDFLGGINGDFDLIGLRNALDEAKPAHLWLDLTFEEQQATKIYFKTYNTEEIEEEFIEKNKLITEIGKHNYGSWQEVIEIYEL
ncbi:DUF2313 domain-containing protein [Fusobacterium sp.]|uniref:DUF2313 domain-containing protein n=1 Tax=Fusobacterium sp. TaxID=68766 RepID=UPI00262F3DD5|nr:DUF2313 domain-containing protein [Fusobacterium sp.]